MKCHRCKTNTEDIYLEDKNFRLCKECITKIVEERGKYADLYIALKQNTRKQAEKTKYWFGEYRKQIQDLEELVEFMQTH